MTRVIYHALDEQGTQRLGEALVHALRPGTVVALSGTLGAGKTRLVQAAVSVSGTGDGVAVSPTFMLINEYDGEPPVFHMDAYRLTDSAQFEALGVYEYFDAGGLTFVEWAEKVREHLPDDTIEIVIDVTGGESRTFTVSDPSGQHAAELCGVAAEIGAEIELAP